MKLTVLIPIWKRYDVTEVCFKHLKRQKRKFGFRVLIVGSEREESKKFVEKFGFDYVEAVNRPIGRKLNKGLSDINKSHDVLILGSDDIVSDVAFHVFEGLDSTKNVFYGIENVLFYRTKTNRLTEYRYGKAAMFRTVGAGRLYTRTCLQAVGYELWSQDRNRGLDTSATKRIWECGGKEVVVEGYDVLDIKHSINLTKPEVADNGDVREPELIEELFGQDTAKDIFNLKYENGNDHLPLRRIEMKKNKKKTKKIRVELTRDIGLHRKGSVLVVPFKRGEALIKQGSAVEPEPEPKPEPKKKEEVKPKKKATSKRSTSKRKTSTKTKSNGKKQTSKKN